MWLRGRKGQASFTGDVDMLYLHYKSFNHKDKLQFSASNVSQWTTAYKRLNFLMTSVRIHSAKSY